MARAEVLARAAGAPSKDLSTYSEWRRDARLENVELLDFYGSYLAGQQDMSGALRIEDALAAMRMDGMPEDEIPDMLQRIRVLHAIVLERVRPKPVRGIRG